MPELPEVETTLRGIQPHVLNQRVVSLTVREPRLRWPVPDAIQTVCGRRIIALRRRAKYLLLQTATATATTTAVETAAPSGQNATHPTLTLLIHLGMSGSLRICEPDHPLRVHDHIRMHMENGLEIRYHDPRRFGCWLLIEGNPRRHPLLTNLGPEPLSQRFNLSYLLARSQRSRSPIKTVIMDQSVVVGVGNIYACEALHSAGIHPECPACAVAERDMELLVRAIRKVLRRSIRQGGTTLRDFVHGNGEPGYFR